MAVTIEIGADLNSQSIANNTSNVTVIVRARWTGGSWNHQPGQVYGWAKIDGTTYNFKVDKLNPDKTTSGSQTVFSKTLNISHASDGAKTLYLSASMETGLSSGTQTASSYMVLPTIYSTSVPSLSKSSVDMGGTVTIYTNRESTSMTHDLAYSFAGSGYTTIKTGVGSEYTWTVPDLASKIPDSVSGTATIRCITKSGGTTVGTKTVTITLKVPSTVVPTISSVAATEATTGLAAKFGAYIRYKSKVSVSITAAGAKGSTIKSYSTTLNGRTYTGAIFTSRELQASGSLSLVSTVTDSRGRTAKKTTTITVLDYAPPSINILQVYRVNDAGETDSEGVYVAIRYKYGVTSLSNKNTASMVLEYKRTTGTEWEELLTGTELSADTTEKPASPTFSTDYQFDFRIRVTDWFGTTVSYIANLSSGAVILDIGADGTSLSIGKTAEHSETFEIAWKIKSSNGELPQDAISIPGGADLDNYKTPGYYVFPSASYATIQNMPIGGSASGSVLVIREGDSTQVRQVVTRCSTSSREIWERLYYSSTWQEWQCVHKAGTRVLWTGAMYMTAGHTATLSELVSEQPTGIELVFSEYYDGEAKNQTWNHVFISKTSVALHPGGGRTIQLSNSRFNFAGTKYLYIHDDRIVGHDSNNLTGTGDSGIVYTNNRFVLRYVIGV